MTGPARILSISFSEYVADARVLRQLRVLADYGDVTTIGFGPKPEGSAEHIELAGSPASLPQTVGGVVKLALRRYRASDLAAPANQVALQLLSGRRFDLVVANEARALPLAHAVANGAPVWGDMHEWAPAERTHVLSWRLLVAPFMHSICARYLPRTAAVTTVNDSIADLYREHFGCDVEVVRNAIAFQSLIPSPLLPGKVRLVHSGGAVPGRNLEQLITVALELDERFSLDLYLVPARDGGKYLAKLRALASGSKRVIFHDPVAPDNLPKTLNDYDIGVFILPPQTVNHKLMLPNKFFDFVQGRLGMVFSPAVETTTLIEKYGLGLVTADFSDEALKATLASLSKAEVERFKSHADVAAASLSSAEDEKVQRGIVERLLPRSSRTSD